MKSFFISYSHQNMKLVDAIELLLKSRGVPIWRDLQNLKYGHPMEIPIRTAIANPERVFGYLLVATPDSWTSFPVKDWEIRTAVKRYREDPDFPIMLVVQDMDMEHISIESEQEFGVDLSSFLAIVLPKTYQRNETVRDQKLVQMARSVLSLHVENLIQSTAVNDGRAVINLHTRERTVFSKDAHFTVDLRAFYENGNFPTVDDWSNMILPGLLDIKTCLAETYGPRLLIEIQSNAHLSTSFALGYTFRESSGFNVVMDQGGEPWFARGQATNKEPLKVNEQRRNSATKNVIVEVCITHETQAAVDAFICKNEFDFRVRQVLRLPDASRTSVEGQQHALDIAEQVATALRKVHDELGNDTVCHVFYSGPSALAMMIGYRMNAVGKVQIYDLSSDRTTYHPAGLLC